MLKKRSLYGCCDNPKCLCLPAKCLCMGFALQRKAAQKPEPTETENEVNAHQHIRIGLALLVEDREHWHSREAVEAFLQAELEHAFKEAA